MNHDATGTVNCNIAGSSSRGSTDGAVSEQLRQLNLDDSTATIKPSEGEPSNSSVDATAVSDITATEGQKKPMINPLATHLVHHPERGNGVFASTLIRAGTVIEDSPSLVITREQWEAGKMDDCILGSYGFCWRNGGMGIGLGLASLFNHSSSPNANFVRNYDTCTIRFTAARTIQPNEELCISYAADESKLWFVKSDPQTSHRAALSEDEEEPFPSVGMSDSGEEKEEENEERRVQEARRLTRQQRLAAAGSKEPSRRQHKKAEYTAKQQARASPSGSVSPATETVPTGVSSTPLQGQIDIVTPTPISAVRAESSGAPSRSSTPNYPSLPDRAVHSPSLPPPLHSSKGKSRHEHAGPVILTADLDWSAEDFTASGSNSREGSAPLEEEEWTGIERIKGFTEREEDQQLADDRGLVEVWVLDVADPRMVREVLHFIKERLVIEPDLKHLKRVCRRKNEDGTQEATSHIALCTTRSIERSDLVESLSSFSPLLASLEPYPFGVPKSPARDQAEWAVKQAIWPVGLAPPLRKPDTSPRFWSAGRRAWVEAGIKRVISLALDAKSRGELPSAVYCTSPPTPLWPRMEDEGFIPPTPGLRASSHDTRISEVHPLRHANLNCIASIARLRTVPPFSELLPTRNGADYLLTSLSLFTLHEPCTMCTMALLHSRVREVFYVFPSGRSGGFEGEFGLHSRKDLNHRFEVWKWKDVGFLTDKHRELLRLDPGVEV